MADVQEQTTFQQVRDAAEQIISQFEAQQVDRRIGIMATLLVAVMGYANTFPFKTVQELDAYFGRMLTVMEEICDDLAQDHTEPDTSVAVDAPRTEHD